ncbi:LysR family transcriptional regulator [Amorphus orientalis]|uniref:DNA-binding transcriptional LysR family regulator n=1 Tax=Amorphus orientalis TaxID=649198 RepID=A0AAE3VRW3_9HYPH|nr:LysR family transcriptional regulator [Amorphus orientalis]MDQ0317239.1 DNA-binding transcriptional LysR family regulator [Amorphus orientalis]
MDTLARMAAFVAVVDAGGFSAAARKEGRSKAILSKHVAELENRLGVRLLNRTTRTLAPTEAGLAYYREALEILQRMSDLEDVVRDTHREVRGSLRIAVPRTLGEGVLMEAIVAFARKEPRISLDLRLDDRFVDLVEEGFDMAVRVSELADSSLIARKLAPLRLVVAASPELLKHHGRPSVPDDMAALPCVIDTNARWRSNWGFVVDGTRHSVAVSGRLEANSPNAAKVAALHGIGFAMLPYPVARREILEGRLETVLDDYVCNAGAIYAVYPHRRHLSGKVRALVDHLAEWFGDPVHLAELGGAEEPRPAPAPSKLTVAAD